jgi:cyclase
MTDTDPGPLTAPEAAALHEIADGVFAWVQPDGTWWINNAGAVTGADGTIIIDTCATEQRTRRFLAAVRAATGDAPLTMAVNTHQHGDHTYGNSLLPASTVLIGHEAMREGLLTDPVIDGCPPIWQPVPDWGRVTRRVPSVVLRSELTLFTGSRRVDLHHPGHPAHTTGDVVAWLPEERVLYSGDLIFHGVTPLVFMGSVEGAIASLGRLADYDPEHVVPGHGPVIARAELPDVLAGLERYYRLVQRTAQTGRQEGMTPLQAAWSCDLGEFATWPDAERLVLNLHRAYADAAGAELDLVRAFTDAVEYNGGPMAGRV